MRIVSTTCSNTEIVCALGCAEMLVGVDDHSDFPEDVVARVPRVGPDLGVDPEKVAALEPDVVLASLTVPGHERVIEGLEAKGLRVVAPEPVSLEDVYSDIATIAELLGVPERGARLVASMRREIDDAAAGDDPSSQADDDAARPTILVEWWPKPVIVPGRRSWVTDLIHAAGGSNPWQARDVKSTPLRSEEVLAERVDAVVISWCGVHPSKYRPRVVYRREGWGEVRALAEGRVVPIPEAYLGRPGPRLVEGFRALREVVKVCRSPRGAARSCEPRRPGDTASS